MERKQEWEESASALRHVIRDIVSDHATSRRVTHYKFAAILAFGTWHIYNAGSDNIIATLRRTPDRFILRYRQNSVYRGLLQNFEAKDMVVIRGTNFNRNRRYVRTRAASYVTAVMRERRRERREARRVQDRPVFVDPSSYFVEPGGIMAMDALGIPPRLVSAHDIQRMMRTELASERPQMTHADAMVNYIDNLSDSRFVDSNEPQQSRERTETADLL